MWQEVPSGGAVSGKVSLSIIIITLLSFCHYHAPPINHLSRPGGGTDHLAPPLACPALALPVLRLKLKTYQNEH